ncbi:hypothetical protein CCHL11_00952 [Colletotrichum chlorophyti]|uniref:F-box domain-containing protein n=1 Tax=Colletotrichum chlorophyti TaxID=708187 RepID=A0A1Q8S7L4_9PEZI|nr:hypothetical protein CCHL11_00952 [Colletotrichum chlorophyti]
MSGFTTPFDSLPNEILIAILSTFESRTLLPLALVDRRFNATATAILQYRLLHTANMNGHEMMLESYHPSAKQSTPSISCRFTGVDFLNRERPAEQDMDLRSLSQLYSHFRPVVSEATQRMRRVLSRRIPGAPLPEEPKGDAPVIQHLYLDDGELFSQLCTTTRLVKSEPGFGFFASRANIEKCVLRVWRHWLAKAAAQSAVAPMDEEQRQADESTVLWADSTKNVGLRFRVTELSRERTHALRGLDEDPPVAYILHYEELLVRTSQVLLAMEESALQEEVDLGKAIIITSS